MTLTLQKHNKLCGSRMKSYLTNTSSQHTICSTTIVHQPNIPRHSIIISLITGYLELFSWKDFHSPNHRLQGNSIPGFLDVLHMEILFTIRPKLKIAMFLILRIFLKTKIQSEQALCHKKNNLKLDTMQLVARDIGWKISK